MGILSNSDISYIYNDYSPAFDNLYTVEIYPVLNEDFTSEVKDYIKFHATSVTFNGESLNLDRNPVTKNFQVSDEPYTRTDTLSITWRECDTWKIKKYHDTWLSYFYSKESDHFWSYPRDNRLTNECLCRRFVITLPHRSNDRIYRVTFNYVFPNNSAGLNLGWKENGAVVQHTLNYFVTDWTNEFNVNQFRTVE